MSIPSLTALCTQKIVSNENLLKLSLCENLPIEVLERIKNESMVSQWKWFVTPIKNEENPLEFNLTPRNYEDFCMLCSSYQVKKQDFLPYSNQENHDFLTVSKIVGFVREKGRIIGNLIDTGQLTEDHQQTIQLCYYDVGDLITTVIKMASATLPYKKRQTVKISLISLEQINQHANTIWNQETCNKLRDFVIYYVNQFAIDNSGKRPCVSQMTNNRLHLAQQAKTEEEVLTCLFGKYEELRS